MRETCSVTHSTIKTDELPDILVWELHEGAPTKDEDTILGAQVLCRAPSYVAALKYAVRLYTSISSVDRVFCFKVGDEGYVSYLGTVDPGDARELVFVPDGGETIRFEDTADA